MSVYGKIDTILLEGYSKLDKTTLDKFLAIKNAIGCAKTYIYFTLNQGEKTLDYAKSLGYDGVNVENFEDKHWYTLYQDFMGNPEGVVLVLLFVGTKTYIMGQPFSLNYVGDSFMIDGGVLTSNVDLANKHKELIQYLYSKDYFSKIALSQTYVRNGNIIIENGFVIVGGNEAGFNTTEFESKYEGKKIIYLGPPQSQEFFYDGTCFFYHIDLYLMYLGKIKNKHHFFIATIPEEVINLNKSNIQLKAVADILNELSSSLRVEGMEVTQVPLLYNETSLYTNLNGIVEVVSDTNRNIYIPMYSFPKNDELQALNEAYLTCFENKAKELGYNVKTTADFTDQIDQLGALHCTVNIIKREEFKA